MKKIFFLFMLLSFSVHADECPIIYHCTVEIEDLHDLDIDPYRDPFVYKSSARSRDFKKAIESAFRNNYIGIYCGYGAAITSLANPPSEGHWQTYDMDEKYLQAVCTYTCVADSI